MSLHLVNEHNVDVPDDMFVKRHNIGPGSYDSIEYRGHEILTVEMPVEPPVYIGPFAVTDDKGNLHEAKNLHDARIIIDFWREHGDP
jgi:hypothetical protein